MQMGEKYKIWCLEAQAQFVFLVKLDSQGQFCNLLLLILYLEKEILKNPSYLLPYLYMSQLHPGLGTSARTDFIFTITNITPILIDITENYKLVKVTNVSDKLTRLPFQQSCDNFLYNF